VHINALDLHVFSIVLISFFADFPDFSVVLGVVDIHPVQPQGVGDHAEAAQAHGRRAEHGTEH
jgi:hypothetical protein